MASEENLPHLAKVPNLCKVEGMVLLPNRIEIW